jgi:hypothetical protein
MLPACYKLVIHQGLTDTTILGIVSCQVHTQHSPSSFLLHLPRRVCQSTGNELERFELSRAKHSLFINRFPVSLLRHPPVVIPTAVTIRTETRRQITAHCDLAQDVPVLFVVPVHLASTAKRSVPRFTCTCHAQTALRSILLSSRPTSGEPCCVHASPTARVRLPTQCEPAVSSCPCALFK